MLLTPQINVYTTPGRKDQGHFALEVASKIIPFFVDYFGTDYPLPKADLIGQWDLALGGVFIHGYHNNMSRLMVG